jgi:acyl carrier protein
MTPPSPPPTHDALRAELVALICDATRRDPVDPATVSDATPCIGGALLADSLDVLETVVAIDRAYGVSLRDGEIGRAVFADMGSLTRFVAANRVR